MNRKIGVFLSFVLMIFEVLSTLLLTPFIIRTLGQAEYGVYKLVVAVNAYLLLLDLGVGNAITRYVAKFRIENNLLQGRHFLGVATIYYLFIAIVAVILGVVLVVIFPIVFANGLSSEEILLGQKLLSITMLNSAITLGSAAYTNVIVAYEKFGVSRGSSIIQIIIRMLLTYISLKLDYGSLGIVEVNLFTTIICRGFYILYVLFRIKLRPLFKGIESSFIKEIATYSSLILLQMLATQLNSSVDQVIIGAFVCSSAVILGIYGVGTQIVQYFQSIGSAFTGVLMPGIVKLVESDVTPKKLTDEMIRIGIIILMALALIWGVFVVLGKNFIILWAGNNNDKAYYVAIVLMTAYTFTLTETVGSQILWSMNQHKEQSILKLLIVVLNIILTIILVKWNPLIGATIGTFISIILGDVVVMNVIFVKKIKINLFYYYKKLLKGILPCTIITIAFGIGIRPFFPTSWLGFITNAALMVILYSILMYIGGMNSYEKKLILSLKTKS